MPRSIDWRFPNGERLDPRKLKAQVLQAAQASEEDYVEQVADDLRDLLHRLNQKSTSKVFSDAEVDVERDKRTGNWYISVPTDSHGGYVFSVMDQGTGVRRASGGRTPTGSTVMRFPAYDGNLTKTGPDSAVLNNSPPVRYQFISKHEVEPIPARKFLESVIRRRVRRPYVPRKGRGRFVWQMDPKDISLRVVED